MKQQDISLTGTLLVITAVQFLTPFMFSAIGVALPTIGRDFHAGAVHLGLIEMVYILGVAILLLPMGRFADIHGRKRMFLAGAAMMTVATLALALAETVETLILFRFWQGLGAAMITSTSLAILTSVFPKEQRGRAMGFVVSGVYLGISAGPLLAGLMIEYLSWRWIFYTAIPIELAALGYALLRLKGEWADSRGEPFDWLGSAIYVPSLCALIVGVIELNRLAVAPWLAGCGLVGLLGFLAYESSIAHPILPVRMILAKPVFFYSNLATWLNYAASFGIMFFFSFYLQIIHGISPKSTGLILIVQPLLQACCAPIAGRLSDRHQPTHIATAGMVLCSAGLACAALLGPDSSFVAIAAVLVLMGLGFGFFSTPNTTAIMAAISPKEYAMAASLIATMRTTGMLTSMTLITLLLGLFIGNKPLSVATGPAFMTTMHVAMVIFALLSLVGIFFSCKRQPGRQAAL